MSFADRMIRLDALMLKAFARTERESCAAIISYRMCVPLHYLK